MNCLALQYDTAQYAGNGSASNAGGTGQSSESVPTTDRPQEKMSSQPSAVQLAASLNSLAIATKTLATVPSTSPPVSRPVSKTAGISFESCFSY